MKRYDEDMKRGIYRSRNGVVFGVCRGLAEHFGFSVFWVRFILVMVMLMTCFWPVLILYVIASLVMKPEPVKPFRDDDEQEFYDAYTQSREKATRRLKKRYKDLERRIRRMEDAVTSREYDWDRRMNTP